MSTVNTRWILPMNNTRWIFPVFAVSGGLIALALRLIQNLTGFESSTGLPVRGNVAAICLAVALAVICVLLGVSAFALLPKQTPVFPFRTDKRLLWGLPTAGAFVLILSGLADMAQGLSGNTAQPAFEDETAMALWEVQNAGLGSGMQILCGILTILSAAGLLWCMGICTGKRKGRGLPLLIIPVGMVIRLVGVYRMDSINPVLEDYAVQIIALALLTLAFYHLSAFAFEAGHLRRFAFYAGMTVVFCICSLADAAVCVSFPLMYAGGAMSILGFLLLVLETSSAPPESAESL